MQDYQKKRVIDELTDLARRERDLDMSLDATTTGLKKGPDGIWYGSHREQVSYPDSGYQGCFAIEDQSFWFRHRNRCIITAVQRYPPHRQAPIVDIGGGNGYVSKGLENAGFEVILVEPGQAGARNAKARGVAEVICANLEDVGFIQGSMMACGLFDVLEHIEEDTRYLEYLRSLLIRRGRLYLTVPAYPFLWSNQDELAGHFRRYTLRSLERTLNDAGFAVAYSSYFFRFLLAAIFCSRTLPSWLGLAGDSIEQSTVQRDHVPSNPGFSRFIAALLNPEIGNLRRGSRMYFGASCLVVAERT